MKSLFFISVLALGGLVLPASGQSSGSSDNGQVPYPASAVQGNTPPESAFDRQVLDNFLGRGMDETWDISASSNKYNPGMPVAIHFSEWGQPVVLGNAVEQIGINQPFELVIGFYEKLPNSSEATVVAVHDIKIAAGQWQKLWGKITPLELKLLDAAFKTGPDRNAMFYARGESARIKMKGATMQIDPRIDRGKREIICYIPFGVFNTQLLGQPAPEKQQGLVLWGKPFRSKIEIGSKPQENVVAMVDHNGQPVAFKKQTAQAAPGPQKAEPPKIETKTTKTVLTEVQPAGPGSIQPQRDPEPAKASPAEIEAAIQAAQQGTLSPNTPGLVKSVPDDSATPAPAPPPPVDTGWSKIDTAPVKLR